LAVTALSGSAFATDTPGWFHPQIVRYQEGILVIQFAGIGDFVARQTGTPSPCANQTLDTLRAFQILAQAAFLSGKNLKVTYCTSGINYISQLQLGD
jgi:hypothetical protein